MWGCYDILASLKRYNYYFSFPRMFAKSVEMFLIGLLLVALLAFGQVKY